MFDGKKNFSDIQHPSSNMKLSEIGEFGLIERIRRGMKSVSPNVLLGIGDDAAVLKISERRLLVATTDMMVEGVHFLRDFVSPYALGFKAMASSLSDIAAVGGVPRYALISLALPKGTPFTFVQELYRGLQEEASAFAVEIVGGDTSASSRIVLALTILGEVEAGWYVRRS
ncbi:MAG: thiamine-phosphate kinase, partial [Candidatus Methylomirabilales bacterium]